jgi:hypothetical protein
MKTPALVSFLLISLLATQVDARSSISRCGFVFVTEDDGTHAVYQNGELRETFSSGTSLSDIVEKYCE